VARLIGVPGVTTATLAVEVFSVMLVVAVPAELFVKPVPEIVTAWPGTPDVGVTVIVRLTTVKRNEAVLADASRTTTVFVPVDVPFGNVNEYAAVDPPSVLVEYPAAGSVLATKAVVEVIAEDALKSESVTETVDPGVAVVDAGVALAF